MQRKTEHRIALVVLAACFFARPAHAYIDPGTGSCVLQTLLGILFGLGYATKVYWSQIRAWFRPASAAKNDDKKSEA